MASRHKRPRSLDRCAVAKIGGDLTGEELSELRARSAESNASWPTIGPCCGLDSRAGMSATKEPCRFGTLNQHSLLMISSTFQAYRPQHGALVDYRYLFDVYNAWKSGWTRGLPSASTRTRPEESTISKPLLVSSMTRRLPHGSAMTAQRPIAMSNGETTTFPPARTIASAASSAERVATSTGQARASPRLPRVDFAE